MRIACAVPFLMTALIAPVTASHAQPSATADEDAFIKNMQDLVDSPPAGADACDRLDKVYFPAAAFQKKVTVSTEFRAYYARLALLRRAKVCPKRGSNGESPLQPKKLIQLHDDLVKKLKSCAEPACRTLQDAFRTSFVTLAHVLPPDDPELARIIRELAVWVSSDELTEELIRKIRNGQISAQAVLDIAKSALNRASADGKASPLLPTIADLLKKLPDAQAVPEATLKELLEAVFRLAANRKLSPESISKLLAELQTIVSDEDLIHLGEALALRRDVKTEQDFKALRSSVALLIDIYPELKEKLDQKEPQGNGGREQYLLALSNLLNNAQMVELNRLRAAQSKVVTEPERLRRLRILVVKRELAGCQSDSIRPVCRLSHEMVRGFLSTIGSQSPDSVSVVEVPGSVDEISQKAVAPLTRWTAKDREVCDRAKYGALCEWPFGGVVIISSENGDDAIIGRATWRERDAGNALMSGNAATVPTNDIVQAFRAGAALGIATLRDGTLWKMMLKELPVRYCTVSQPPPTPRTSHPWIRAGLVVATGATALGAVYSHNTSPSSSVDDWLWKASLTSLVVLTGFELWDLLQGRADSKERAQ